MSDGMENIGEGLAALFQALAAGAEMAGALASGRQIGESIGGGPGSTARSATKSLQQAELILPQAMQPRTPPSPPASSRVIDPEVDGLVSSFSQPQEPAVDALAVSDELRQIRRKARKLRGHKI